MGRADRPLSALTYVLRNPRRVLPVALVQALVTALMVAVITPLNIFESTSEAYIRPLEAFTIVQPLTRNDFEGDLQKRLDANPAGERTAPAKMLWIDTPMIVGDAPAPLLALDADMREEFMSRVNLTLVEGRLPTPGTDEAALHRGILTAREMKIGDEFGRMVDFSDTTPGRFRVVGVLDGPARLGLIDLAYASRPTFVLARISPFQLVYAKPGRKAESDAFLKAQVDDEGQQVFFVIDEAFARARTSKVLRNLPLLIGFVSGAVALIVALVTALLNVITFHSRTDEFALLLAVGHRRRRLVKKLVSEAFLLSTLGWLCGLLLGMGAVRLYSGLALEPKGIVVRVLDFRPVLYSLAVPLLSAAVSAVALAWRLRRTDPVTVIQRRGG